MSEEQPLLGSFPENADTDVNKTAVILDFEPGDVENPREWPSAFKWMIVLILACTSFTVTFTCIAVVPIAGNIVGDLSRGQPGSASTALLITVWELGEAAGPLLVAPLSEMFGRSPVMNAANVVFVGATLLAALCRSVPLFIGARALTGLAVAGNVLNPAIIGDLFAADQRGSAMSLVMLAPLIGGAAGPTFSGVVSERLGWRTVLLIAAALATACAVLFFACFRETYKLAILRRRMAKMQSAKAKSSEHMNLRKLWESVSRPVIVLFGSGVLLSLSLYGAVSFSFFYVVSVSLPDMLLDVYGFTPAQTGAAFISMSAGSLIAIFIAHEALDRIYVKLRNTHDNHGVPEYRLPFAILAAFLLPLAVSAYGWIAQARLPVWLLLVDCGIIDGLVLFALIPLAGYVVDSCGVYSASAMTGIIVTRCLMGTFLPLTVDPLVESFGFGWGMTVLGGVSLLLAPIPPLVMRYGHKWRQHSEFTRATGDE